MAHSRPHRGFTLIELLVVFSIIVVVTTIAITSQSSFNRTVILANTAYDVALSLRSAQTFGLGSRAAGVTANAGYGIHFEAATPNSFTFFADTYPSPSTNSQCHPTADTSAPNAQPGNCSYDSAQGEQVTTYRMGNGITISNFCVDVLGSFECAQGGDLTVLDIVFARPNPDPFMSVNGVYEASYPISAACVTLTSPQGGARFVSVGASGEITANATSCP